MILEWREVETTSYGHKHDGEDKPRCWYGVPATPEHWCIEHEAKTEA